MKGTDCMLYAVHLWFASVLPLLLVVEVMSLVEHEELHFVIRKYTTDNPTTQFYGHNMFADDVQVPLVEYVDTRDTSNPLLAPEFYSRYMDGHTIVTKFLFYEDSRSQLVLGASMAVFLFCLHGLRILWPKGFIKGEFPRRLRVEDVDCMVGKWFYGSLISVWMCAHVLFLVSGWV